MTEKNNNPDGRSFKAETRDNFETDIVALEQIINQEFPDTEFSFSELRAKVETIPLHHSHSHLRELLRHLLARRIIYKLSSGVPIYYRITK